VPCHRVVAAGGKPGGFSSYGGLVTKARLLQIESGRGDGGGDDPHAEAIRVLSAADPKLGRLIARVGPCRLANGATDSPFEALLESIVYQQLTGKAAATILGRVQALFEGGRASPQALARMADETLRAAGLSGAKTAALKDLAARTLAGEVPDLATLEALDDEAIIDRLTIVRGIGRWTVEMLLMFRLGRPDVLPATDYGVRKGYALTFGRARGGEPPELPTSAELLARGERWKPYRSIASWYLWRALELPR
jgi:3-methyladenine DNA glycosylase/8-oxoguanine DNA glycosylase